MKLFNVYVFVLLLVPFFPYKLLVFSSMFIEIWYENGAQTRQPLIHPIFFVSQQLQEGI